MTRAVTLAGYAVLAGWLLGCELWARRRGTMPTFATLVHAVRRRPAGRALLLASWLWLGWHLFVRVHR